ncbi:proline iminopeptidase-family hydrolase [Aliiglaciecola sp. 3_MG-2023]|uniref:proline iminopeptidase-family hydrolase n=1 Tax=Aliiglaciecola sp. 3_MG-2023 TaxID=3062644 RepID=UPI0026E218D7|nr:proline iminopeptidase-family hydrolase [Aliiglaciecola sp. 3_MG-2023]MDO6693924.1 proline iminopeptidase-family hydrolase [Aliiglaciecola sp. 3_MG-2023]
MKMTVLQVLAFLIAVQSTLIPFSASATQAESSTDITEPFGPPEQELMVEVEGGKVYVRQNGLSHSDAIPVIFVHGGPGGTHNGFAAMLGLANERRVIMYDQLDSGKSDQPNAPANWRVERFVESLDKIRLALNIERWHVVGHSWGSALALEYAAKYPQHTVSTVLGGTFISTPHWIMDANLLVTAAPKTIRESLKQCESESPPAEDICENAYSVLYSPYYQPKPATEAAKAYYKNVGGNGFNPLIYNQMWGPSEFSSTGVLKHYDATHLLTEIDGSRTLFMIGQYDSARIDTVQDYIKLTPGAELAVVPGGAHGFYSDRPIITQAILKDWLARKDSGF